LALPRPALAALAVTLIALGLAWTLAARAPARADFPPLPPGAPAPRHVVVVSLDTTRADALGPWAGPAARTPAVDALAAQGVTYLRAYASAPTTLASHTTLWTGNPPHTHGVPRNDYEVNAANVTLPELFADAGWTTAAFLGAMPLASHSGFTQGFSFVDERFTVHRTRDEAGQTERPGAEVVDAALAWLDGDGAAAEHLFLFVHLFDAHAPYAPPADLRPTLPPGLPDDVGSMRHIQAVRAMRKRDPAAFASHAAALRDLYAGGVREADRQLGRLLDGLRARGLLDDSVVFVLADHGETFDTHEELFDHGETVYDETVHVPLIARWPGGWRAGERVSTPVGLLDVAPTLHHLFDLPAPPVEGRSLLTDAADRGPLFVEATKPHLGDRPGWNNDELIKGAIDGHYKLIMDPRNARRALYDLDADPGELTNVRQAHRPEATALQDALDAWRAAAHPLASRRISDERVKAELEALGYVE
jgi:arylsulfatase A-like enzyme